jgi:hypothetical protein
MSIVCGIDPGLQGAICVLSKEREILELQVMPLLGSELDIPTLMSMLLEFKLKYDISLCVLEKSQCRPGQSAQSGLKIGRNYGILEGLIASLRIPYREVAPQTWTKSLMAYKKPLNAPKSKLYKLGKERNVREAQKRYPNVDLKGTERSKVAHLGKVDALLIADYGLSLI